MGVPVSKETRSGDGRALRRAGWAARATLLLILAPFCLGATFFQTNSLGVELSSKADYRPRPGLALTLAGGLPERLMALDMSAFYWPGAFTATLGGELCRSFGAAAATPLLCGGLDLGPAVSERAWSMQAGGRVRLALPVWRPEGVVWGPAVVARAGLDTRDRSYVALSATFGLGAGFRGGPATSPK